MIIHFFTYGDEQSGSSRQRAFKVADELNARGMRALVHRPSVMLMSATQWPKKGALILQLLRSLASVKKGDIVYLQRTVSNKYFFISMVVYLFFSRRKMIFDFDDPVYLHSFFKTKIFTQMADVVITCTHMQAEWAKQYNSNMHMFHILVDFSAYQKFTKQYQKQSPLRIGWVGAGPEHLRNLEILARVFTKLVGKTNIPFTFVLIGALKDKEVYRLFENIPTLDVEFIDSLDWTDPESVPREIQKFDIGVQPHLSEGRWNQAKTSLKILEYMACGVATVSSTFGEMPYIVEDGVNGYLAHSEEEWVEKLEKLLSDRELREKLGKAGQKTVSEGYSFDATIPRLVAVIESVRN
jgi:glycosyltransferase involved in cell wall biosynthesis